MKPRPVPLLAALSAVLFLFGGCSSPGDDSTPAADRARADSSAPPAATPRSRIVTSHDGTRIAVYEHGLRVDEAPTVVLVHGYPDTAQLWDAVVAELAPRYHLVTYDTRGSGGSDHPERTEDYRLELLAEDFAAVTDAVAPGKALHLVGHDWGGVQSWEPAARADLAPRISSFTTVSGPSIDLQGQKLRHPQNQDPASFPASLLATAGSYYMLLFLAPIVPELAWEFGAMEPGVAAIHGVEGSERQPGYDPDDGAHAVNLYRANIVQRIANPTYDHVDLPLVQVIIPDNDQFVRPGYWVGLEKLVPLLWKRHVEAGHWAPLAVPQELAAAIAEAVEYREQGTPPPANVEVLP